MEGAQGVRGRQSAQTQGAAQTSRAPIELTVVSPTLN